MGYEKQIVLIKKLEHEEFSAPELLDILKDTAWEPTLAVIDSGDNFDWIQAENRAEFDKILKYKAAKLEFIGFTLKNRETERYVTVHVDQQKIVFDLDIGKNENESEQFEWFYNGLVLSVKSLKERMTSIEWRSGYDNAIIKSIE